LLLLPCLVTPVIDEAVDELIAYFRNNTCALPFSEQDAQTMRSNLFAPVRPLADAFETNIVTLPVTRSTPLPRQPSSEHDTTTESTVRYLLQHELLDTVSEYMSVADLPATTAVEHAQALRLCADRIQLLGISAAGSELIGLMDCCLLCHDALIKRLDAHSQLSDAGREQFKVWASLVARYLDSPNSAEVVDALLAFYQRGHFIPPMLQCEYDSLRYFLLVDTLMHSAARIEIKAVPERTSSAQIVTMPFVLRSPAVVTLAETERVQPGSPAQPETTPQELSQLGASGEGEIQAAVPSIGAEHDMELLLVPAQVIYALLGLLSQSIAITSEVQERLRIVISQPENTAEYSASLRQLLDALEQMKTTGITSPPVAPSSCESDRASDDIPAAEPQPLEIRNVLQNVAPDRTDNTDARVTPENVNVSDSDAMLHADKVPVSTIVARLQRSVRQTCRVTGKQVNLTINGAETLLDRALLDALIDPLMHLLRNAIEHGIEPLERRRAAGKADPGTIDLRFSLNGDFLVLHCADDGEGLDYARIQQIAAQKGLIEAGQQLSELELNRVVLLAGITTRSEDALTSGHGIGLAAVASRVTHMKGTLHIASHPRRGCAIELRIPMSLVSMHALLVQSNAQVLAISNRCIEQVLPMGAGQLQTQGDRLQYCVATAIYDAYEIERLLYLPIDRSWIARADRPALLVRDNTGQVRAVFVERVLLSQELVVKQLGAYLPKILGIDGATILANGDVAAVIDLPGLLQVAQPDQLAPDTVALELHHEASNAPLALVAEAASSTRRMLAGLVKDLGFDVITAIDGAEALEAIKIKTPDLVLTNIEMPQMNGLALVEQLRSQPHTENVPIIMLSARSSPKYRELALRAGVNAYLTNPFVDGQLAEQIRLLTNLAHQS
ncbi:MAG: response regulator, partial [Gammaproteobacteria bacterium]|nr:response regulator [Gammaproteobacteria bacterium]